MKNIFLYLFGILLFVSCNSDNKGTLIQESEINIRISKDPYVVHPILSPTSRGRLISQYIFKPLADYHPVTMELHPILIENIPVGKNEIVNGEKVVSYTFTIKKDAIWSDGKPITGLDYMHTIKTVLHPQSNAIAWRPYFEFLKDIKIDPSNNKTITVYYDRSYMLSLEAALTAELLPSHISDPEQLLINIPVSDITNPIYGDSTYTTIINNINNSKNLKLNVVQSGPYEISHYEPDLYYVLQRKENYWGLNYPDNPFLQAYPEKMNFKVVPDDMTAVTMAKEESLDFVELSESNVFMDLKEDSTFNEKWRFHVPQTMLFYYMAINNKHEILGDKNVRKALAHLTDVEDYIQNINYGLGVRTTGPFHPVKKYYNNNLSEIKLDIPKAKSILKNAGWFDTNNDGILDKEIDGNKKDLTLTMHITGSTISKSIAILFQETTKQAGVKLNIVTKSYKVMKKENLSNFNFDLTLSAISTDTAPDDIADKETLSVTLTLLLMALLIL